MADNLQAYKEGFRLQNNPYKEKVPIYAKLSGRNEYIFASSRITAENAQEL
jgi:hypothetical protein